MHPLPSHDSHTLITRPSTKPLSFPRPAHSAHSVRPALSTTSAARVLGSAPPLRSTPQLGSAPPLRPAPQLASAPPLRSAKLLGSAKSLPLGSVPARRVPRTGTNWKLTSTSYQVREKPGGRLRGCEVIAFGMCGKNHGLCNLLFGLCTTVIRGWWHTSHVVVVDSLMRSDFADDRVRAVRTSSLLDMDAFRA